MNDDQETKRKVVIGKLTFPVGDKDRKYPHVSWVCPACGKWHDTDLAAKDRSPLDLECEMGRSEEIFSVSWKG